MRRSLILRGGGFQGTLCLCQLTAQLLDPPLCMACAFGDLDLLRAKILRLTLQRLLFARQGTRRLAVTLQGLFEISHAAALGDQSFARFVFRGRTEIQLDLHGVACRARGLALLPGRIQFELRLCGAALRLFTFFLGPLPACTRTLKAFARQVEFTLEPAKIQSPFRQTTLGGRPLRFRRRAVLYP
jgi:hypothetical protein